MWKKLLISIVLAAALLWLAFSVVDREKFADAMRHMDARPVAPILALFVLFQLMRAVRWWLLVGAVRPISLKSAAVSAFAGFMAINVFPLRTGELVRPLVLKTRDGIPFASGVAAVLAERVVDAIAVFVLLLVAMAIVPAREIAIGGQTYDLGVVLRGLVVLLAAAGTFLLALVLLRRRLVALVERVLSPAPRLASLAGRILGSFVEGLEVFKAFGRTLQVVLLTAAIWGGTVVSFWLGFGMFGIDLPLAAAIPVLAITMAGITVPAGIGMSGNYQVFCIAALALYGADGSASLAYSVVMNVLAFLVAVGMGLCVLPFLEVKLGSLVSAEAGPRS